MRRSKRRINAFINHLFGLYHVPRIPIYIHWQHESIVVGDEPCFGFFHYEDDGKCCIHAAAAQIGTSKLHEVIAHEFVHYLQWLNGRISESTIEEDAEYMAAALYGQWLINKTKKNEHCYGVLNAWERKQEAV